MRIIAAIDDSGAAETVLETARHLARLTSADVRALHVADPARPGSGAHAEALAARTGVPVDMLAGEPVEVIVRTLSADGVLLGVLGARRGEGGKRPAGHNALAVATAAAVPVVVAPPEARTPALRRLLVPLEGIPAASSAVAETAHLLERCGVEVIPLHVFGPANVPRFWDHPEHAAAAWSDEFLFRFCTVPSSALRLRGGDVGEAVLKVAAEDEADLIALAWSQDLSAAHARTVRTVLSRAHVPVLLVPLPATPAAERSSPGPLRPSGGSGTPPGDVPQLAGSSEATAVPPPAMKIITRSSLPQGGLPSVGRCPPIA